MRMSEAEQALLMQHCALFIQSLFLQMQVGSVEQPAGRALAQDLAQAGTPTTSSSQAAMARRGNRKMVRVRKCISRGGVGVESRGA